MRVLIAAPEIDNSTSGHAYIAFKWAEALSKVCQLTVLGSERPDQQPLAQQLPGANVVTCPHSPSTQRYQWVRSRPRTNPSSFSRNLSQYLKRSRKQYDIAHMLVPKTAHDAIPFWKFALPYVIGPVGSRLLTQKTFTSERPLTFMQKNRLDTWRLRHDPWLRKSYAKARLVIGVAPFMRDMLADIPLQRFETMLDFGIDRLAPLIARVPVPGQLRLLHVGRGIRSSGLRDTVRALSCLRDLPGITLTSAGGGEDIAECQAEAESLGVADRCTFLGHIPRYEVEALYASHDLFVFPSYQDSSCHVLYEAMRWGLPIVTTARGTPGWIVDQTCGICIPVTNPSIFADEIALVIRAFVNDPARRQILGQGARNKVLREALWSAKAIQMRKLYEDIIVEKSETR